MTTTPAGDGQPGAAEQAIHDALQRIDRIERRLQLDQHLQMVPAATEPPVRHLAVEERPDSCDGHGAAARRPRPVRLRQLLD